jgi:hypothetical protein
MDSSNKASSSPIGKKTDAANNFNLERSVSFRKKKETLLPS